MPGSKLNNAIKARIRSDPTLAAIGLLIQGATFIVMNSKTEFLQPGIISPSFAPLLAE